MFTTQNKRVIVSVINDLVSDIRVQKTCNLLADKGFDVLLIGRKLPNSNPVPFWKFKTKRMTLVFKKGVAFYFFFNVRLFFNLLFTKVDLLYANDLDTLLPNYLVSKIKAVPLIYDSHELFCEVPELQNTPVKKKMWLWLERKIVPNLKHAITVNNSIAKEFKDMYGTEFTVVRNIPPTPDEQMRIKSRKELGIDEGKKMVLLQGAGINIHRGAEELVEAMKYVNNAVLYIIGSGDVWEDLKKIIAKEGISDKVILINKLPKSELLHYTKNADLGVTIDKPNNLNYLYSLPNKLFDYIHCEVPVLSSKLVELEKIIKEYEIGDFIENHDPKGIAAKITEMLQSEKRNIWKKNLLTAKNVLTWEREKESLEKLLNTVKF